MLAFKIFLPMTDQIPRKLCECGCGKPTSIARCNDRTAGYIKGQALRFVRGHRIIKYQGPKREDRVSRKVLLRRAALAKLGNRCANPNCRWMNEDGSFGCTDSDLLHIDHENSDGSDERKRLSDIEIYRRVIEDEEGRYKALCANCNWKKRKTRKEDYRPPHTEEAKLRIGRGRTGWKHSEETKRRMSFGAKHRGQLAWSKPS